MTDFLFDCIFIAFDERYSHGLTKYFCDDIIILTNSIIEGRYVKINNGYGSRVEISPRRY